MQPPHGVLLVALALPLVMIVALTLAIKLSNKQVPWVHRIVPVALVSVVSLALIKVAYTPHSFRWSEWGICDDTFGAQVDLAWSDIEEARRIPDVWRSEFTLALRTNGTAYGPYRAGSFRLANGDSARVFMMTSARDAVLIRAHGAMYLFAPEPFEDFAAAVKRHVP